MRATVVNVLIALTNFFVARATYMGTGMSVGGGGGGGSVGSHCSSWTLMLVIYMTANTGQDPRCAGAFVSVCVRFQAHVL